MFACESPITLKSGLVVPCGKCLLCLSKRRDEWSTRLQLHSFGYYHMPLFCGLTYDPDNLRYGETGATLCKKDLQLFVKRLKDRYNLYNTKFSFFACGEYGDLYGKPHYHILLFGFDELFELYQNDWLKAHQKLREVWQLGNVDIGIAKWSGIHYVTKYVLKIFDDGFDGVEKPFLLASNHIGLNWLDTQEAKYLRRVLSKVFKDQSGRPLPQLDLSGDYENLVSSARDALQELKAIFPKLVVHTPQGIERPMPRYIRDHFIGHFEHFTDNPYWYIDFYQKIVDGYDYAMTHLERDDETGVSHDDQVKEALIRKIRQRLYLHSKQFKNESFRYGTNQKACL